MRGQVDAGVDFVSAAQHSKAAVDFPQLDAVSVPCRLLPGIPWFLCAQGTLGSPVSRSLLEVHVHPVHRGENIMVKVCLCMHIFIYCTYWQAREVLYPKPQRIKF